METAAPRGRTRWRRFAGLAVPALVAVAGAGAMMTQGALAVPFAASGRIMKVSAGYIDGQGLAAYQTTVSEVDGTRHAVTMLALSQATVRDLCQSVHVSLPVGAVTMRITAATKHPAVARNMMIGSERVTADSDVSGAKLGLDASTLRTVPGATGLPGGFGMSVDHTVARNVRTSAWTAAVGTVQISGIDMTLHSGSRECF